MKDILLKTPSQGSIIHCGSGTFEKYAPKLAERQLFVVTDSNVFAYYRYDVWRIFGDNVPIHIIPAGETGKTLRNLTAILRAMLNAKMRRNCTVVAFGGGVVGDIAGLAASLYMRGVHLVQIPTTLLAQVDSSVGGKTAVDFEGVKNVIGSFYQPEEVIADPLFLKTLPDREIRCGLGEIVKYGALSSHILSLLQANVSNLKSPEFLEEITYECIAHKAEVVMQDEHDLNGLRKTLNLGHTTGHAFELFYSKKSHGEFVLIGMYYELYMAEKLNTCSENYANTVRKLILSVIKKIPVYRDVDEVVDLARFDKKNEDKNISLVVPQSEGKCTEIKLSVDEYSQLLTECAQSLKVKK